MSYKSKLTILESEEFLLSEYSRLKSIRFKKMVKCLLLFRQNEEMRQEDIASKLGISHATIKRWYKTYRENGYESLIVDNRKGGNNPSVINKEIHDGLAEKLSNSEDPLLGYWDAVLWVKNNYNVEIHYQTLRGYMKRHFKCKLKMPRKSHYKSDHEATESFKKNKPDF